MSDMDPELYEIYTKRDMQALRDYLVTKIPSFTDKWTDTNSSDLGVVFLELAAGVADMLGFYLDKQSLETHLSTVKQRKNAKRILSLINYQLAMVSSSVTSGRFTIPAPLDSDVVIPKYTQVSSNYNGVNMYFATKYAVAIKAGDTTVDTVDGLVPLVQGILNEVHLNVGELKLYSKYRLYENSVANGSVTLDVDGTLWTEVPDVLIEEDKTRKFSVHEDNNDNAYLLFDPLFAGDLPIDSTTPVKISFLVSNGLNGNVQSHVVNRVVSTIFTNDGTMVDNIYIDNTERATGGADRESVDHARVMAPRYLRSTGLAITLEDYETLVGMYPGVVKCKAVDWASAGTYITSPYMVDVYIVPTNSQVASTEYLREVSEYMKDKLISSINLTVKSANYYYVDIVVDVYVTTSVDNFEKVRGKVVNSLNDYFDAENLEFQSGIYESNLATVVQMSSNLIDHNELVMTGLYEGYSEGFSNKNLLVSQFPVLRDLTVNVLGV